MIKRTEEPCEQGTFVRIESSDDCRINTRGVVAKDGTPHDHIWISVPTDFHIIVKTEELRKLHEVIGATLARLA